MKKDKAKKNKKRRGIPTVVLVLIFLVGLSLISYSTVSNWWNSRTQSQLVATYKEAVEDLTEEENAQMIEAAQAFNKQIQLLGSKKSLSNPSLLEGYYETLDITGTGIMGYVTIEKLGVELPIYHGTDSSVLQIAAGHLEGSSLPVGGAGTHAVISAHRGLPTSTLFTNLDQLEIGDYFTITVLDETLIYQIDQIAIVLPNEGQNLYVDDEGDYVTLMTCTPYAVNTHRLLVRGVRVETASDTYFSVSADAYKVNPVLVAAVFSAPVIAIVLMIYGLVKRKKYD